MIKPDKQCITIYIYSFVLLKSDLNISLRSSHAINVESEIKSRYFLISATLIGRFATHADSGQLIAPGGGSVCRK